MDTLVLLYMLYLELGGVGQGKVTILKLSRYMRVSKSGMKLFLEKVNELGYINVYEVSGAGNYMVYKASINNAGQAYLDANWDAAREAYHKHVAETVAIINMRASGQLPSGKKMSKKAVQQLLAGQKELF